VLLPQHVMNSSGCWLGGSAVSTILTLGTWSSPQRSALANVPEAMAGLLIAFHAQFTKRFGFGLLDGCGSTETNYIINCTSATPIALIRKSRHRMGGSGTNAIASTMFVSLLQFAHTYLRHGVADLEAPPIDTVEEGDARWRNCHRHHFAYGRGLLALEHHL